MRSSVTGPAVVFLNRFYWPDVAATAQMLTDLAEDLAQSGWQVTVIASDAAYEGEAERLPGRETRNGVRILRTRGTRFGRHRLSGRVADYLSYLTGSLWRVLRGDRPDVVVAMSDPPFLVSIALAGARLRGARTVYWVQDLFPQIAGALGVLRPRSIAYRLAERLARWLHGKVDLVVALGPRMAERMIEAGTPPDRVTHVHNWADAGAVKPVAHTDNPFRRAHALEDRFVVLYSGNAGRPHRFDGVLRAAELLRDDPAVLFLFIGGGKRTPELKTAVTEHRLQNVRFLPYLPREELPWSLTAADVSLVTEDPAMAGLLVPSKTYGILASGRPLVFMGSANSDVASVVQEAGCGFVLDPADGEGLAAVIRRLHADPALVEALGTAARQAAERRYDRPRATSEWASQVVRRLKLAAPRVAPDNSASRLA